jgi:hypothetical protein
MKDTFGIEVSPHPVRVQIWSSALEQSWPRGKRKRHRDTGSEEAKSKNR